MTQYTHIEVLSRTLQSILICTSTHSLVMTSTRMVYGCYRPLKVLKDQLFKLTVASTLICMSHRRSGGCVAFWLPINGR